MEPEIIYREKLSSKLSSGRIPYSETYMKYFPSELIQELDLKRWEGNFNFKLDYEEYIDNLTDVDYIDQKLLVTIMISGIIIPIRIHITEINNLDSFIDNIINKRIFRLVDIVSHKYKNYRNAGYLIYYKENDVIQLTLGDIHMNIPICYQVIDTLIELENLQRKRKNLPPYEPI